MNEMVDGLCDSLDGRSQELLNEKQREDSAKLIDVHAGDDSKSNKSAEPAKGVGVITYESGDIYNGQLVNGRRDGKGKMSFAHGDTYVGQWRANGMCDAEGVYTFKNGSEYRGGFRTSKKSKAVLAYGSFEGAGQLFVPGSGTFIGQFIANCAVVKGQIQTINGRTVDVSDSELGSGLSLKEV